MSRLLAYCTLFLFFSCLWVACDNGLESVTETDEYGHTITYQRRKTDFAREGWTRITNAAGTVMETAYYQADTLEGQRTIFYDNGDTSVVETYRHGRFEGPYRRYYEGGTLKLEGRYTDNQMNGPWLGYHENGQLKERVLFQHNDENGPFIEYHPNGNLAAEGTYKDGDNEDGELKIYDESGALLRIMLCDYGRCRTTWSAEQEAATNE